MKKHVLILCLLAMLCMTGCGHLLPKSNDEKQVIVSDADTLSDALLNSEAGTVIILREGIYEGHFAFSVSGTETFPIELRPYSGERAVLTIPNGSDGAALHINGCSNIVISGLVFSNLNAAEAYGILMTGGESNITIRECEFSNIVTTAPGTMFEPGGGANAILLFGEAADAIAHVTIENNSVHDNVNGWSENISVAGNCENITVKDNEVFNCTNIGIDFYGNAEYCSELRLDQPRNCECIGNTVYHCRSTYAANAGIYVDGAYDILVEDNEVYGNPYRIEIGSEEWRSYYSDDKRVHGVTVKNNLIHDNEQCGLRLGGWTNDESTSVVFDCEILENRFENNFAEILLSKCDTICFEGNEFADGAECENAVVYDAAISSGKITGIVFR